MSQHQSKQAHPPDRLPVPEPAIRSMHDIFQDPYRRAIIACLQDAAGPLTVDELAGFIRTRSTGIHSGDETSLAASLRQDHLMPMDDFGVVEYDPHVEMVRLPDDVTLSVTPPWRMQSDDT